MINCGPTAFGENEQNTHTHTNSARFVRNDISDFCSGVRRLLENDCSPAPLICISSSRNLCLSVFFSEPLLLLTHYAYTHEHHQNDCICMVSWKFSISEDSGDDDDSSLFAGSCFESTECFGAFFLLFFFLLFFFFNFFLLWFWLRFSIYFRLCRLFLEAELRLHRTQTQGFRPNIIL